MNRLLPVLTTALIFISFLSRAETILSGAEADRLIPGSRQIHFRNDSRIPSFVIFDRNSEPEFRNAAEWMHKTLGIAPIYGLELINTTSDDMGFTHYRYRQTFDSRPIDGTMWLLHVREGRIVSANGFLIDNIKTVNTNLSESDALNKALNLIHASVYKWQMPGEESDLKRVMSDPNASYFPKGKLVYSFDSRSGGPKNYRLAYKFDIYSHEPLGRKYVFVDANNGSIVDIQDRIWEANANGTAVTGYSGTQPIITDSHNGSFRLRESNRGAGQGIETYNMLTGTDYGTAVDFTDADNHWNNVNAQRDQYATDAHFAAEKTYDYYYNTYGRNSIDNAGLKLLSYVHYSSNYVNAFWDGLRMTYGDGSGTTTPLTSLDIGGHEITHGLTSFTADLIYAYESGALNESFSDIFGTSVEWYADPANADWLMGEDIGSPFRSHSNPNTYGDPDTYQGLNWHTGTGDNGGVHTNSGVQNFWFYLLSVGGSGTNDIGNAYSVTGIGMNKAAAIAYRCLTYYLTSTSGYEDARTYSIQSAIDLFGSCSPEMLATVNAWYAVGVGGNATMPTTLSQSGIATFCSGDSVQLFAKANTGSTYQWFRNNIIINGASTSTLYASSTGSYTVTTNFCGNLSTSNAIPVNVVSLAPTISPSGSVSSCTTLQLTAQNTSGYNVQWNRNGVPLSGATGLTYTASQSGNYTYTVQASVTPAQTLSNNSVVNIVDASCNPHAFSTITPSGMPASIPTAGISIRINLTHTWDGDIDVMLEAPNGDILGLSHNAGEGGDNFTNTVFSDAGASSVISGTAPFTGTFKPWPTTFASCVNTTHSSFKTLGNGTIDPNGNWTLHVYDRYGQDVGTIVNWSLMFPELYNPSPNCGPVTTANTTVSIGSDAAITITPGSSVSYSISSKTAFPATGRSFGTSATINDKAYFGFGENSRSDWWEFNPATNTWTQKNSCPIGHSGGSAFSIGTKIYVVGGFNGSYLNNVYQWDSGTNAWTAKNVFGGGARAYTSAATVDGKGYVLGGADNANAFNDIWEYNSVADSWTLKTTFGANGRKKMSVAAIGGKIYFGLGQSCTPCNVSNQWFEYDVTANAVASKSNFGGTTRENACGFSIDSKAFIIFGNSGATQYKDYWEYNPSSDQWFNRGTYSGSARSSAAVTVVKNKGYFFSGNISGTQTTEVLEFKSTNTICTNAPASVNLLASSGNSYLWSNGATTQSITGVSAGEYSVTVTNVGCSGTAHSTIAVHPVPTANVSAGGPLNFCSGSSVSLTADLNTSYLWSTGETTRTITATNSGNYTVIVTGAGGCTNSSSAVNVTSRPGPPVTIVPSGPTQFCSGGSVTLSAYNYRSIPFAPLPGSGTALTFADDQLITGLPIGFSFMFFGNTYSNFNLSSNGFISFSGSGSGCCIGQLLPNPTSPNNLIALAWTDLNPPAGGTIEYFTTGVAPNRKLVVNYINIRHYPNVFPVTAQLILYETLNQAEIHTTSMPTDGTEHTMGLENSNGTQAVIIPGRNRASFSLTNDAVRFSTVTPSYSWTGGATTGSINATSNGLYSVTVSEAGGCTATSSSQSVTVFPLPNANITASGSTTICTGDNVTLTSSSGSSYLWSTGATTQSINVSTGGSYSVTVTSSFGCTKTSASTNVTVTNCTVNCNLKLFVEGFYKGGGFMEATVNPGLYPSLCDTITLELHNTTSPYAVAFTVKGTINTNGNGTFVIPGAASGNSYYLAVIHRNALETWSAAPVLFSGTVNYDFTTAANKAFGNNMIQNFDGTWSIYSGDVSSTSGIGIQDGVIESQDYADMENAVSIILTGYRSEDITGDQIVESGDYSIIENNVGAIIFSVQP